MSLTSSTSVSHNSLNNEYRSSRESIKAPMSHHGLSESFSLSENASKLSHQNDISNNDIKENEFEVASNARISSGSSRPITERVHDSNSDVGEVEVIICQRFNDRKYLVKWSDSTLSWETKSNLIQGCSFLLQAFHMLSQRYSRTYIRERIKSREDLIRHLQLIGVHQNSNIMERGVSKSIARKTC
jgi:hypothetical protein